MEKIKRKKERQTVPLNLKHCTSGFYSTPQVVELLERNSESKGTKDQPQHTFLQHFTHLAKLPESHTDFIKRRSFDSLPPRQNRVTKAEQSYKEKLATWVGMFSATLN